MHVARVVTGATLSILLGLAGCGSADEGVSASDARFVGRMVVQHEQAAELAGLARDRAGSAEVRRLAFTVLAEQRAGRSRLAGWLRDHDTPIPLTGQPGDPGGMMHGGWGEMMDAPFPGRMSDADIGRLKAMSGLRFDRSFVRLMLRHHRGSLQLARAERAEGSDSDAVTLARRICREQREQMVIARDLLRSLLRR